MQMLADDVGTYPIFSPYNCLKALGFIKTDLLQPFFFQIC